MSTKKKEIKVGDTVTFDTDNIESFMADTESEDKAVQDYKKLVLAGVDQIGTVKEIGYAMATVSYPDGWELPVPVKYLLKLGGAPE